MVLSAKNSRFANSIPPLVQEDGGARLGYVRQLKDNKIGNFKINNTKSILHHTCNTKKIPKMQNNFV